MMKDIRYPKIIDQITWPIGTWSSFPTKLFKLAIRLSPIGAATRAVAIPEFKSPMHPYVTKVALPLELIEFFVSLEK